MQKNIFMDFNHETAGLNRRPHETFRQYWKRISTDKDFINAKKDYSLPDLLTLNVQFKNASYKTSGETYYFSISSGEKKVNFCDTAELFHEPKSTVKQSLGFDADLV